MSRPLMNHLLLLLGVVASAIPSLASSAEAKYFRHDEGVARSGAGPLPDDFDAPGVLRWRVPLDPGHSTPILVNGKIILTAYRAGSLELATIALDETDGKTLWRRPIAVSRVEQTHPIGSPATATPACDGRRVFVFFGSYGLLGYDLDG